MTGIDPRIQLGNLLWLDQRRSLGSQQFAAVRLSVHFRTAFESMLRTVAHPLRLPVNPQLTVNQRSHTAKSAGPGVVPETAHHELYSRGVNDRLPSRHGISTPRRPLVVASRR